ncbi:spore coat U domain-containing protein [Qipengyuania sediminis]|uniref:Csu type fimbrial protein n=1 Tax=Qipengyuania sediminis TaxID=1532023 RepID=UPI00105A3568|nr:spore coat U domain-containing protein [Qipengyuania sediminis]
MGALRRLLIPGAALLAALPAVPAAARNTMVLNAQVVRSCNLGALPMMFGTVSIVNPTGTAQSALIVDCTPGTTFTVTMDNGLHFRAGSRRMANPAGNGNRQFIDYEIFRNAARTQRWGATAATGITTIAPADGKVTLIAYGRADGRRSIASAYEDTVTVTISF